VLWFRSFLFAIGLAAVTLLAGLLSLVIWPLPYPTRYRILVNWARFTIWWLSVTCGVRYQVEGLEHVPETATIILSKHQSAWETIAFQVLFPRQVWVMKRELAWIPFFGWALALLNPITINRKKIHQSRRQIIQQGRETLAAGNWVVIFPEGTRVAPGERKSYGLGGALLAENTHYPVLPIAHNAGKLWPRQGFIKKPGTVHIVIGPAIDPYGKSAREINTQVEAWIEQTMLRLNPL